MHKRKPQIEILAALLALIGLVWLLSHYHEVFALVRHADFSQATLVHALRGDSWAIIPLVILLSAVSVIPGAPNAVVAVVSGICLGAPLGFVANVLGLTIGNNIGALLIHHLADEHSQADKQTRVLKWLQRSRNPRLGLLIAYAVPFIPNTITHVAAARLGITGKRLAPVIALASVPTAFFYAFGGDAVLHLNWHRLIVVGVLLGLGAIAAWAVMRRREDEQKPAH